jgi:glycerol uptake facilitator-like aquaporin
MVGWLVGWLIGWFRNTHLISTWRLFFIIVMHKRTTINNNNPMLNKYFVEFFGTLFFIYIILATGNAIAIGAALAVAIMIGGPISGGMFNPAVSIAMVAAGKLSSSDLVPYILAQVAGGLVALELFKRIKL